MSDAAPSRLPSDPYAEPAPQKSARLLRELNALVEWHAERCAPYAAILRALFGNRRVAGSFSELPFLPVRLFKMADLASVPATEIVKTLTSSGTTGQRPSRIFLDKEGTLHQSRVLASIVQSFLGPKRLPMLVIDTPRVLKDRAMFSARGAAIQGFSLFGRDLTYALDDDMQLATEALGRFADAHRDEPVFLFGFTSIVWQHLYRASRELGYRLGFGGGSVLIHGGGWKKLAAEQVSNAAFKAALREQFGIDSVINYYGMVEQTGTIHLECERGYLHAPASCDVLIRDQATWEPLPFRAPGLVQVMSELPRSYPGHVLLTEDVGAVAGEDDCGCGRKGKYFTISGRLPNSELRGCSDTHEQRVPHR